MSIFTKIGYFFSHEGKKLVQEAAKIAVAIVEFLKTGAADKTLDIIGYIIDALCKNGIGTTIVDKIKLILPSLFSLALGIESPASASAEDLATWTQNVLDAFGKLTDTTRFLSILAADLAKNIQEHLSGKPLTDWTFADYFAIVQDTYQDYLRLSATAPVTA